MRGFFSLFLTCLIASLPPVFAKEVQPQVPTPKVTFIHAQVDDSGTGGNGNGIPEPGETVNLTLILFNIGTATAFDVYGYLSALTEGVTVTDDMGTFGNIAPSTFVTQSDTFTIQIAQTVPCGRTLHFSLYLSGTSYSNTVTFDLPLLKLAERDTVELWENTVIYGDSSGVYFGNAITAGDVNGDGIDELIVGAPYADGPSSRTDSGAVWILYPPFP